MTKAQDTEDRLADLLNKATVKLTKTTEALNGAQTHALALWAKEILQHSTTNTSTRRRSLDVKRETDLGRETLKVKKELKAEDQYLVRLRHKLNMLQEKEHGAQVRRNINLRHNMDNFNDALNNVKKAIMGGAGFQNAIGTTVKKMASMTRSYQELEIANKKVTETKDQLKLKQDTVNNLVGSGDDVAKKNAADALKIAESAHQSAQEGVIAATKPAEGTQGMLKPMFEKLGKLGEFLGKKAVPIGIGVGVAGIFMSIIVKAFSASPLFAQMMKMMKFMVTLILMPIGTFFGALLRPILIMLLRKFIIPFYSEWMPKLMKWGAAIGDWLVSDKSDKFEDDPTKKDIKDMNWLERLSGITSGKIDITGGQAMADTGDESMYIPDIDPIKNPPAGDPNDTRTLDEKFQDGLNKTITTGTIDVGDDFFSNNTKDNPLYVNDQHTWGSGEGLPDYVNPITPGEGGEATDEQKMVNRYIDNADIIAQEQHMDNARNPDYVDPLKKALEPIVTYITNPKYDGTAKEGQYSRITDAGISEGAYESASETRGHVKEENYSQATKDLLASMRSGVIPAANGFEGMVNSPTMFLAGESGSEHVSITPSGSGGSGGITVNIQNMNGSDNDLRKLKKTILEVIQESSANRGRI